MKPNVRSRTILVAAERIRGFEAGPYSPLRGFTKPFHFGDAVTGLMHKLENPIAMTNAPLSPSGSVIPSRKLKFSAFAGLDHTIDRGLE
jgi:hypothetical protein